MDKNSGTDTKTANLYTFTEKISGFPKSDGQFIQA